MRVILVVLAVLSPVSVLAQPLGPNWGGFLEPHQSVAPSPGINSNVTGRQFGSHPTPGNGPANADSNVSPDTYRRGIGTDEPDSAVQPVARRE